LQERTALALALALAVALTLAPAAPARAVLAPGRAAPAFRAEAALAGNTFTYDLDKALAKGPVVMFFVPHAFTGGCDYEAHLFADRYGEFKRFGASVIAVSKDRPEVGRRWSKLVCANKFPVLSDVDFAVARAYDDIMRVNASSATEARTTYVIMPNHTVGYVYRETDPSQHVERALIALADLTAGSR
jgi:peroxiredoxin